MATKMEKLAKQAKARDEAIQAKKAYVYTKAEFAAEMEWAQKSLTADIEKFKEKFAKNPMEALRWGDDTFEKAARLEVLGFLKYELENQAQFMADRKMTEREWAESLIKAFQSQKDRAVTDIARMSGSTSPCSNLSDKARAAAWIWMTGSGWDIGPLLKFERAYLTDAQPVAGQPVYEA